MKSFRIMPLLILSAAGFGAGLFLAPTPDRRGDPDFDRFDCRLLPEDPGGRYDAVLLPGSPVGTTGALRLFWDAEGRDGFAAAEIADGVLAAFRVEQGVRSELGRMALPAWPRELRLRRREDRFVLLGDDRILLSGRTPRVSGGRVGVGFAGGAKAVEPTIQRVAPILFTDDFMRGGTEAGEWVAAGGGQWRVRSLDNPARSSNAFVGEGVGGEGGLWLVGRPWWDAIRIRVSALGAENGAIGLVTAATESPVPGALPGRYALVRWTAGADGRLEIVLVGEGGERVLASRPGGYRPGQWVLLEARLGQGRLEARIDGHRVLEAVDPCFAGGRAGLYARGAVAAEFDDVRIESLSLPPGAAASALPWEFLGSWSASGDEVRSAAGLGGGRAGESTASLQTDFALLDGAEMAAVEIAAEVVSAGRKAGLVCAYRDPANHLAGWILPDGSLRLVRIREGAEERLAEGRNPAPGPITLRLERGIASFGPLEAVVGDLPPGRVGLQADRSGTGDAVFRHVVAEPVEPPAAALPANQVFEGEELMLLWSGGVGDWRAEPPTGGYEQMFWHRSGFPGEAEIETALPAERQSVWRVGLSLAKDGPGTGYTLILHQEKSLTLRLFRNERLVKEKRLSADAVPSRLCLRRFGRLLAASVDDRPLLAYSDPEPLAGRGAAWATEGAKLDPEQVTVRSRRLLDYAFDEAPVDWRRAAGVWQVANRWECDPRWSFLAGMPPALAEARAAALVKKNTPESRWAAEAIRSQLADADRDGKLAALWHKGRFPGDVTVECFVAQMMDQTRGGSDYKRYARDFALTLAADGRDLDSGYAFILGADGNRCSRILRGRTVVAECPAGIPVTQNIHRKWFRLRAERQGGVVRFSAYTQEQREAPEKGILQLEYRDPDPLPGDRVAAWTWDNGMMLARLRIAHGGFEAEDPFAPVPVRTRSAYDEAVP